MYHPIEDQEKNPDSYVLTHVDPNLTEDECHDLLTKPRQTQKTIGLYLKKISDKSQAQNEEIKSEKKEKRFTLTKGSHSLERELKYNKGFWVDKPQYWAHFIWTLRDRYTVDVPRKTIKGQGIFFRPEFLELEHHIKLANAGLLYSDEESSDSEDEGKPDTTLCLPLRKVKYKICDPCKTKKQKVEDTGESPPKDLIEEMVRRGEQPEFKKIPTGCQCDFLEHNRNPTVWDKPFIDRFDMLRQHEMNKYMKPFKHELLRKNYDESPPVKFMVHEPGRKRTFPVYNISNL